MTCVQHPAQTLRNFTDWLDAQSYRYDRLLWRDNGERSTVAETYRQIASQARQHAYRYARLAEQPQSSENTHD